MQCVLTPFEPQATPTLARLHSHTLDTLDATDSENTSSVSTVSNNKPDKVLTHEQYSNLCSKKKRYRKKFKKAYKKYKSLEKKYSIIQNRYKNLSEQMELQLKQQFDAYSTRLQAMSKSLYQIQDFNHRLKKQCHLQVNDNRRKEMKVKKAMKKVSIMYGNLKQVKRKASKDLEVLNNKQSDYERIIRKCKITENELRQNLNISQLKCIEYQKEMVKKCTEQSMNIHHYQQSNMNFNLRININDSSALPIANILRRKSNENMNNSRKNGYRNLCLMKKTHSLEHQLNIPQEYQQKYISSPPVIHRACSFDGFGSSAIYLENLNEDEHECVHVECRVKEILVGL